jgi:3-oxoacyl-[acyl-carrier-protein] synthase II
MTETHRRGGSVPIAVTGQAVLTPLGDNPDALATAMEAGSRSLEASQDVAGTVESRMHDFEAERYASVRGMRLYSRATRLAICAAQLAYAEAGLENAKLSGDELGVVGAFTCGHMDKLLEYDRSLVTEGVARTNPALMPVSLLSAPGAAVALSLHAKAFSLTVSDGGASSLDALGLGARLVEAGRAKACLVVGAYALCRDLLLSIARAGMLASVEDFRVFDRRSRGTAYGEAAAALVLERLEGAQARGAVLAGFLCGQVSTFAATPSQVEASLLRACRGALRTAGVDPAEIGLTSAGASGLTQRDGAEARALLGVLGTHAFRPIVIAPKANLGDTADASGLVQCIVALSAMRSGVAPPIPGFEFPQVPGLNYAQRPTPVTGDCALVTSSSHTGACSALVIAGAYER